MLVGCLPRHPRSRAEWAALVLSARHVAVLDRGSGHYLLLTLRSSSPKPSRLDQPFALATPTGQDTPVPPRPQ